MKSILTKLHVLSLLCALPALPALANDVGLHNSSAQPTRAFLAYGQDNIKKKDHFEIAREILINEIDPLNLKGKTVLDSFNIMLREGYNCSVRNQTYFFEKADTKPALECLKTIEKEACPEIDVLYLVSWDRTTEDYVNQLSQAKVYAYTALCAPPGNSFSSKYVSNHENAEQKLIEYINNLHLAGQKGGATLQRLLAENFSCGIGFSDGEEIANAKKQPPFTPRLMCTKSELGTKIRYCHKAVVELNLKFPKPVVNKSQILEQLDDAVIGDVKSSCYLAQPKASK